MQTTYNNSWSAQRLGSTCVGVLYWMSGAAREDLQGLPQRTRIQYATLGLAFAVNLLVLVFVWGKVGLRYFGWPGLVVPGLALPLLFVMCLDRLVAMRTRRLRGELDGFNLPDAPGRSQAPQTAP